MLFSQLYTEPQVIYYYCEASGSFEVTLGPPGLYKKLARKQTTRKNEAQLSVELRSRLDAMRDIVTAFRNKEVVTPDVWQAAGFATPVRQKDVERAINALVHRQTMEEDAGLPPCDTGAPIPTATSVTLPSIEVRLIHNKTWLSNTMPHNIQLARIKHSFPKCVLKGAVVEVPGDEVMAAVELLSRTVSLDAIDIVNSNNPQLVMRASQLFRILDGKLEILDHVVVCSSDSEDDPIDDTRRRRKRRSHRRIKMLGFRVMRVRCY